MQVVEKRPDELKPWDQNPRVNDHAVGAVARSIEAFGFNVPILCGPDLTIIAGHTRWKAAAKLGLATVPVIVLEMSDERRKAFAIADNKTAELADWDMPALRDLLEQLRSEDLDLRELGFSDADLRRLLANAEVDEDARPTIPNSPTTKRGDLIQLGRHRLACGDASDEAVWRMLLTETPLDIVVAGPPCFNSKGLGNWDGIGDHLRDIGKAVGHGVRHLKPGGIVFWNVGSSSSTHNNLPAQHARLLEEHGLEYLDAIAWVRSGANFSVKRNAHIRRHRLYYPAHQWEPILVYRKPGPMPHMTVEGSRYMAEFQTDVWAVPAVTNPLQTRRHPAVGPVEIPYRALLAYSPEGAVVVDPFAGSGTTLIAAEKSGRSCFSIEINPAYCDVIIDRWRTFANQRTEPPSRPGGLRAQ